jgi:hypothetical protein
MKNINFILVNFIFIIAISCTSKSTEDQCNIESLKEFEPQVIANLKIKISNTTSDQYVSSQVKELNGERYLFRFNDYQSNTNPASIEIYNLKNHEFVKRIDLPMEGPNTYYGVVNFYVHNFDSIFLHNEANPLTFYLTDSSANHINRWYAKGSYKAAGWAYSAPPYYDPIAEKIWFYSISPMYFYPDDKEFFDQVYLSSFHLINNTLNSFDKLTYPDQYITEFENGKWYPWYERPRYDYIDRKIYVSFPLSSKINIIEGDSISHICMGTDLFDLAESIPIDLNDFPSNNQFYMQSGRYLRIVKDNFRNLLIRGVKFTQEKRNLDGLLNKHYNAQFALIIYRENNPLGIIKLPNNIYNPHLIIPSEEGLLISTDNPFNENNNENYLDFNLISLDKFSK